MNDRRNSHDRDPALLIDRLAADELDDDARQALFAWLDGEPARWRRCAMALLEAREFERGLDDWLGETASPPGTLKRPAPQQPAPQRALREAAQSPASVEPCHSEPSRRRFRLAGRGAMLAVAASIVLAFALGAAADRQWIVSRQPAAPQTVADASPRSDSSASGETPRPGENASGLLVAQAGPAKGGESDGGEPTQQAVPARSSDGEGELIPAYVKSQLERRGYRVDTRRQFVSIVLPDGRRALAPVEQWKFKYVGNRAL